MLHRPWWPTALTRIRSLSRGRRIGRRSLVCCCSRQAALQNPGGDLDSGADPELVPEPLDVALGGPLGDEQPLGDLAVRQPGADQGRNLLLTPAESPRICHARREVCCGDAV